MIPGLCVELRMTLPQPIREASADVLAKCVGASASRYDVHAPDRASIPPGPVGIADDTHTGVVVSPERWYQPTPPIT